MRRNPTKHIEQYRITTGRLGSTAACGANGLFDRVPAFFSGPQLLRLVVSEGDINVPFEHVSVSLQGRCPTWEEMCWVKELFWRDDEVVMQLHPSKESYVNNSPHCLHLWKPLNEPIPLPPIVAVGIAGRPNMSPAEAAAISDAMNTEVK